MYNKFYVFEMIIKYPLNGAVLSMCLVVNQKLCHLLQ